MSIIELRGITKSYDVTPPVPVLHGVDANIFEGERVAIIGRSGADKSTLLNIIGLLDSPTSGEYILGGQHVEKLSDSTRNRYRANDIGFVFQDFHVLGHRTVAENLELKLAINRTPSSVRYSRISDVLANVGLSDRAHTTARLLSGGEKQRLAIARAIISFPSIILADEPTGNLDEENAATVLRLFDDEARKGVAVVVITHDARLAAWADRVFVLEEGRLNA